MSGQNSMLTPTSGGPAEPYSDFTPPAPQEKEDSGVPPSGGGSQGSGGSPAGPPPTSGPGASRSIARNWLVPLAAAVAGLAVGGVVGFGVMSGQVSAKESEINDLQGQLEVVTASEQKLKEERDSVAAAEAQLAKDKAAAEEEAKTRSAELDARAVELDTREAAISAAEEAHEAATFGPGTKIVGTDIKAGTYRSEGSQFCYWERLRGTSGEFDDIIANGSSDGQAVVTIEEGDVAFSSSSCGQWEPVS